MISLQFTLVLTATKSRKVRLGFANESNTKIAEGDGCCARSIFNSAEVWGIMVTIILQVKTSASVYKKAQSQKLFGH